MYLILYSTVSCIEVFVAGLNVTFSWTFSQAAIVAFFNMLGDIGAASALLVLHTLFHTHVRN